MGATGAKEVIRRSLKVERMWLYRGLEGPEGIEIRGLVKGL